MVPALDEFIFFPRHIIAQVIKAELIICTVGDVCIVLLAALCRLLVCNDAPGFHPQETVDAPHKLRLVARKVIIHRDNMDAFTLQGVEICWERCDQCFPFTGLHFGDIPPMECRTAHKLHIKVALPKGTLGYFAYCRKCFRHEIIKFCTVIKLFLEFRCLAFKFVVGQLRNLIFQCVRSLSNAF